MTSYRILGPAVLLVFALAPAWVSAEQPIPPAPQPLSSGQSVNAAVKPGPATVIPSTNRFGVAIQKPGVPGLLTFDATNRHVELVVGEHSAAFVFAVTNTSPEEVTISYVNTSCGCTAGRLPAYPWKLQAGEGGYIDVTMDMTGKFGLVTKTATVVSSVGSYSLTVSATAPVAAAGTGVAGDRTRNLTIATADRQAVFRNDCANCHVQPAIGKTGRELYTTACGICHEAEHRAQMVPDLRLRLKNTDRNYWSKWISEGKQSSLMPAFSAKHGGILSDVQIDSLVEYLEDDYKKNPPPPAQSPTQAAATAIPAPGTSKVADR